MSWEEIIGDLVDTRGLRWVLDVLAKVCADRADLWHNLSVSADGQVGVDRSLGEVSTALASGWGRLARTLGRLATEVPQ